LGEKLGRVGDTMLDYWATDHLGDRHLGDRLERVGDTMLDYWAAKKQKYFKQIVKYMPMHIGLLNI